MAPQLTKDNGGCACILLLLATLLQPFSYRILLIVTVHSMKRLSFFLSLYYLRHGNYHGTHQCSLSQPYLGIVVSTIIPYLNSYLNHLSSQSQALDEDRELTIFKVKELPWLHKRAMSMKKKEEIGHKTRQTIWCSCY